MTGIVITCYNNSTYMYKCMLSHVYCNNSKPHNKIIEHSLVRKHTGDIQGLMISMHVYLYSLQ